MKFNHLNVPDHWRHYWSRYPEGYTILEALISWVNQVDDMVDNQNKLNADVEQYRNEIDAKVEQFRNEIDDFIDRFDERLQAEVSVTLSDWQASGFLDFVINEALDTKYHEMDERLTTQLAQIIQQYHGKNVKVVSGAIRNNGSDSWEPIIDANHQTDMGVESILTGNTLIDINFNFTAKKIISFVITPDETYASDLISVGASVIPTKASVRLYKPEKNSVGARIFYNGTEWNTYNVSGVTGVEFRGANDLYITHEPCESFVMNITPRKPVLAIFHSATETETVVRFYDLNGQQLTTPSTDMSIVFEREKLVTPAGTPVNPKTLNNPSGNLWFHGVFEV